MGHEIRILKANESDGTLTIKGGDSLHVKRWDKVTWIIDADNVASFSIEMKPGSQDVFTWLDKPPTNARHTGEGRIKLWPGKDTLYKYNIIWTDTSGSEHRYDPIIAVRPSKGEGFLLPVLILVFGLLAVFGYRKFKSKSN